MTKTMTTRRLHNPRLDSRHFRQERQFRPWTQGAMHLFQVTGLRGLGQLVRKLFSLNMLDQFCTSPSQKQKKKECQRDIRCLPRLCFLIFLRQIFDYCLLDYSNLNYKVKNMETSTHQEEKSKASNALKI